MNRQEWLDIKRSKEFHINLFYEFYLDKNKKNDIVLDENTFANCFRNYVNLIGKLPISNIIKYYDDKFLIVKIIDKNNNIIDEY